jgi:hypothetical protein
VTVIGEALIGLVQLQVPGNYRARPGGSPFDVAVGPGRMPRTHAAAEQRRFRRPAHLPPRNTRSASGHSQSPHE